MRTAADGFSASSLRKRGEVRTGVAGGLTKIRASGARVVHAVADHRSAGDIGHAIRRRSGHPWSEAGGPVKSVSCIVSTIPCTSIRSQEETLPHRNTVAGASRGSTALYVEGHVVRIAGVGSGICRRWPRRIPRNACLRRPRLERETVRLKYRLVGHSVT